MNRIIIRRGARAVFLSSCLGLAVTGCSGTGSEGGGNPPADRGTQTGFTLIGEVSGLNSSGLSLNVTGVDVPVQSGATGFVLASSLATGTAYEVTVNTQPAEENCTVSNGSGTVTNLVHVDVTIACIPASAEVLLYSFGGGSEGSLPSGLIQASDGNLYGTTQFGGANDYGTVFRLTPGGAETVLYSFAGGSDGRNPQSGLLQASDGNFYGTTWAGGADDAGTVFRITPAGVETVLYSFPLSRELDTASPSGLSQGADGDLYGTTGAGGANGFGTVFKITPAGEQTVVYSFSGGSDGSGPTAGVVQASDGNLYGTTSFGGASNAGAVFQITPAGKEAVLHSFSSGTTDGYFPLYGLIQASDGNFYGATVLGGANGDGTVFEVTPAGVETILYSFTGIADGESPSSGLTQGGDGSFYGTFGTCCATAQHGSSGTMSGSGLVTGGGVFKITSARVYSVLYSFDPSGIDGAGPAGVVRASNGNLYGIVSQSESNDNGAIFQIEPVQ